MNDHLDEFAAEERDRERARIQAITDAYSRFSPAGSQTTPDRNEQNIALRAAWVEGASWVIRGWTMNEPTREQCAQALAAAYTKYP